MTTVGNHRASVINKEAFSSELHSPVCNCGPKGKHLRMCWLLEVVLGVVPVGSIKVTPSSGVTVRSRSTALSKALCLPASCKDKNCTAFFFNFLTF